MRLQSILEKGRNIYTRFALVLNACLTSPMVPEGVEAAEAVLTEVNLKRGFTQGIP